MRNIYQNENICFRATFTAYPDMLRKLMLRKVSVSQFFAVNCTKVYSEKIQILTAA
jgi:hypothetical protein